MKAPCAQTRQAVRRDIATENFSKGARNRPEFCSWQGPREPLNSAAPDGSAKTGASVLAFRKPKRQENIPFEHIRLGCFRGKEKLAVV